VMVDRDLAELYGVPTKALNQAVKRNIKRFPEDFMFPLSGKETKELVTNCDRLSPLKHSSVSPLAFTEHGVTMLSSVLNSDKAIEVNIAVVRAFVRLRELMSTHKDLARKLDEMETKHDRQFKVVFDAIRQLMKPIEKTKRRIGFEQKR